MSVISAGTTSTTAFKVTGDTTGTLQLQTGAVPTTAINISASQVVTFPATTTLDFTGTLLLGDGSAAAPTLAHSGDTNTGMFFPAADTIAFTEGGTEVLRLNSSAQVAVNTAGTAAAPVITKTDDLNTGIFFPAADTIAFAEGGVEAARFDSSGNLGIGTASPGYKLDVRGVTASGNGTITTGFSWDTRGLVGTFSNHALGFITNGSSPTMLLDTSGNLGVGTTSPASRLDVTGAFGTSTTAFTIYNSTGASASNIARIDFRVNNTFGGNERVAAIWGLNPNAGANNGGALVFATSANGTATTPTEKARFDQAGNFGINITNPSTFGKLAIQVDGTTTPTNLGNVGPSSINLYAAGNGGLTNSTTGIFGWNAATGLGSGIGFSRESSTDWGTQIRFYTHPTSTTNIGDITERARFTAAGDFLVGTTTSVGRLTVFKAGAAYVDSLVMANDPAIGANQGIAWGSSINISARIVGTDDGAYGTHIKFETRTGGPATNTTERARIGSDGAFMVRTTTNPTGAWNGNSIANINGGLQLTHPAGTGRWRQLSWSGDGADGNLYFPGGSSLATVANVAWLDVAGVWINASDARQKTNIREIHHGLSSVLQTQPRAYNRNGIKDNFVGFVAQELKQVIPEVVRGSDETSYGVDYGSLVAVAFKAIQELSAKVAALESK